MTNRGLPNAATILSCMLSTGSCEPTAATRRPTADTHARWRLLSAFCTVARSLPVLLSLPVSEPKGSWNGLGSPHCQQVLVLAPLAGSRRVPDTRTVTSHWDTPKYPTGIAR